MVKTRGSIRRSSTREDRPPRDPAGAQSPLPVPPRPAEGEEHQGTNQGASPREGPRRSTEGLSPGGLSLDPGSDSVPEYPMPFNQYGSGRPRRQDQDETPTPSESEEEPLPRGERVGRRAARASDTGSQASDLFRDHFYNAGHPDRSGLGREHSERSLDSGTQRSGSSAGSETGGDSEEEGDEPMVTLTTQPHESKGGPLAHPLLLWTPRWEMQVSSPRIQTESRERGHPRGVHSPLDD